MPDNRKSSIQENNSFLELSLIIGQADKLVRVEHKLCILNEMVFNLST